MFLGTLSYTKDVTPYKKFFYYICSIKTLIYNSNPLTFLILYTLLEFRIKTDEQMEWPRILRRDCGKLGF